MGWKRDSAHTLVAWLVLLAATPLRADDVLIAVATNFAEPLAAIAADFTAQSGHRVLASSAATGKHYAQIVNGAPFEIFLSADAATPARLEAKGLAVAGTRATYAIGHLALWSPEAALIDGSPAVLMAATFSHLAIANPETAPYGAAAREVLRGLNLWDALAPRLVTGESIAQAYQFVASGNAELGFVAWSQVSRDGKLLAGSAWQVPAVSHTALRQDRVLLRRGADSAAARAFLDYLASGPARAIIERYGYSVPAP